MKIGEKNYSWTQALCGTCFAGYRPDVLNPTTIKEEYRDEETCALCGGLTRSGLYVRIDPREVPYPKEDDD